MAVLVTFCSAKSVGDDAALVLLGSCRTESIDLGSPTTLVAAGGDNVVRILSDADGWVAANKMDSERRVPIVADVLAEFAVKSGDKIYTATR